MDIKKVKALVELVTTSGIAELEITEEGNSLKIVRSYSSVNTNQGITDQHHVLPPVTNTNINAPMLQNLALDNNTDRNSIVTANKKIIYSPMVGTFYRSSAPSNPVFVELGQSISNGTVVCIVEAMKLMNQIESEFSGKITKIFVENASPVEYGQPLFEIE
jgi:acetyl-CoA carboxylase biotin carboxyl carrier protein